MYIPNKRTRFPTPPNKPLNFNAFPNDLVTEDRNMYTEIAVTNYSVSQAWTSTPVLTYAGGIRLPIPKKVNDITTLEWAPVSALAAAATAGAGALTSLMTVGAAGSRLGQSAFDRIIAGGALSAGVSQFLQGAGSIAGIAFGWAINPYLYMMFRQANFKEHVLQWTFAPTTPQESETIKNIINQLKYASLPENFFMGMLQGYPSILFIKLYTTPSTQSDEYTLKFRPCAIKAVAVDYTAAPVPSFFKGTGAPTLINLTLHLTEIQLWDKTNYENFL